jgi:hypothetical protein
MPQRPLTNFQLKKMHDRRIKQGLPCKSCKSNWPKVSDLKLPWTPEFEAFYKVWSQHMKEFQTKLEAIQDAELT